jgi:hypothetical protein
VSTHKWYLRVEDPSSFAAMMIDLSILQSTVCSSEHDTFTIRRDRANLCSIAHEHSFALQLKI